MQSSVTKKVVKLLGVLAILGLTAWVALIKIPEYASRKGHRLGGAYVDGIRVPKGFTVEKIAGSDQVRYPMLAVLDDRGRLFVAESSGKNISGAEMAKNPECRIRLLEDLDKDGIYEHSKVFADKLTLPMGVLWYRGGLYVASPPDFLRLDDADGDGVSEHREVILTGWNVRNTASLHGPFLGPDGWLYLTHGRHGYKIQTKEGQLLEGLASRIWRCLPDGSRLERVCGGGFDNPVELVFTPAGDMIATMTYYVDPQNGQRDALLHLVEGGVYPKPHPAVSEFKRTGDLMPVMSKFARIAPSGLMQYRGTSFGPGFQGNLISAQFNPHRFQRHILVREGATFRTQDEDFVTSTDPDFHPTDVLEDADGSLILLDTGAWYVDACPISRISKPDRTGAIYRIRKAGAPRIENPRGEELKLDRSAPADLARHLDDPRPAVRDRSVELLVAVGEGSVASLDEARQRAASTESRCATVFALGRIGTTKAKGAVRAALNDSNFEVRAAAAHMAGMARDREALKRLIEIVKKDEPPVRLAAATAMGQIGDAQATTALLAASVDLPDRFVEHAVIYALIRLKDPVAVARALKQPEASVRKAALIALDQMDGTPLKREQAISFLADANPDLGRAALWVVSHHSDWAGSVVELLRARLRAPQLAGAEADSVRDALLAFCADPQVQKMIADLLGDSAVSSESRFFLLNAIDRSSLKEIPAAWTREFTKQLRDPDARVRARVIGLVHSRGIRSLDEELKRISSDQAESADLRVAALGVLVLHHVPLDQASVELLQSQLQPSTEAALRLSAAQVLGQARLSDVQLLQLANQYLPQSDALILSSLLDAFQSSKNEEVSRALVAVLLKPTLNLNSVDKKRLDLLLQNLPPAVQAEAQPLRARFQAEQAARVGHLKKLQFLLTAGGDLGRGRSIFFGKKVACSSCHTIGAEGGHVGPDLTAIGSIRSGHDLLEAIVFPSASFVPGHEVYRVKTKNSSEILSGVIGEQEADAVTLVTGPNAELRIPRDQIALMERSTVSLMPDGLDTSLTQPEFTDLLSFLQAQR